jgi:hypothetical protein
MGSARFSADVTVEEPIPRVTSDVLVQVHIPKCAGTSIAGWLRRASEQGALAGFGAFYTDFVFSDDSLWQSGLNDPRLNAISAHNVRRFPAAVHGRRMHYFTILRRPLTHVVSVLRYVMQERRAYGVPPEVGDTSRAMAEWLLGRPVGAFFRENIQTNHLALYPWCDATGGRCDPQRYGLWSAADQAAYERERLDVAKDVLRSFVAVGTVERLGATLELLRARCAPFGLDLLPAADVRRENVSRTPVDDLSWIDRAPLNERLAEALAVDEELYAFGDALLDESSASAAGAG